MRIIKNNSKNQVTDKTPMLEKESDNPSDIIQKIADLEKLLKETFSNVSVGRNNDYFNPSIDQFKASIPIESILKSSIYKNICDSKNVIFSKELISTVKSVEIIKHSFLNTGLSIKLCIYNTLPTISLPKGLMKEFINARKKIISKTNKYYYLNGFMKEFSDYLESLKFNKDTEIYMDNIRSPYDRQLEEGKLCISAQLKFSHVYFCFNSKNDTLNLSVEHNDVIRLKITSQHILDKIIEVLPLIPQELANYENFIKGITAFTKSYLEKAEKEYNKPVFIRVDDLPKD